MSTAAGIQWRKSGSDGRWHAFPTEQDDDRPATFRGARCEHFVPVNHVERIRPPDMAALCPACLGTVVDPGQESNPNALWTGIL